MPYRGRHIPFSAWFVCLLAMVLAPMCSALPAHPAGHDASAPGLDANSTLRVAGSQSEYPIGPLLELLEDPQGEASLDDVLTRKDWKRDGRAEPNMGFTTSAWWARAYLDIPPSTDRVWYLEINDAILNRIDVYFILPGEPPRHLRGGGWVNVDQRDVPYRTHVFQIPDTGGAPLQIYLRIESELALVIPARLVDNKTFARRATEDSWSYSIYFGFISAMLLFNLIVWLRMNESANLLYCGFCFGLFTVMLSFSGYGRVFFWTETPQFDNYLFPLATAMANHFSVAFTDRFLFDTQRDAVPWQRARQRFFVAIVLASIVIAILVSPGLAVQLGAVTNFLIVLSILFSIVMAIRQGNPNAWLLLAAWAIFLAGCAVFVGRALGILPSNLLTLHAMQWGSMLECLLLVVALVEKSRRLQEENMQAAARYAASLEADVKARTEELVNTQQKLVATEKMAALGVFTAGMAHEINNPANFVSAGAQNATARLLRLQGFVSELLDDEADPDIRQSFDGHFNSLNDSLGIIHSGIQRIETVVKHLRITHPEGTPGFLPADVVGTLESAWAVLTPGLKAPIELITDLVERPAVECMIAEINQVFLALLSNAMHALDDVAESPGGKRPRRIELRSGQHDGQLVIEVRDFGVGIPEPHLGKVFDPFFTTREVGRGSGLGLSMARDIIRKHGGEISLASVEGEGTTATLSLPLQGPHR